MKNGFLKSGLSLEPVLRLDSHCVPVSVKWFHRAAKDQSRWTQAVLVLQVELTSRARAVLS